MDSNYKNLLTPEQINAAFYINGDQDILLERVSKGDKAAMVQLVLYWMPYVISTVLKERYKGLQRTHLIDDILNKGVIKLIDEKAEQVLKTGKVKRNWQNKMFRYIRMAINESMKNEKFRRNNAKKYSTPERLSFLNKINSLLKKAEREIIDRVRICLEAGQEKLTNNDPFTVDYMVESRVKYFLRKNDYEAHTYIQSFNHKDTILERDYGLLLTEDDWYESGSIYPALDQPYCYLMHDLLFHSRIYEKVFELDTIWIDIVCTDQKGIKITKDGSSKNMKFYNFKKDKNTLIRG